SPGGGGSPGCAGSALSAPSGKIFERSGSRGFSLGSNGSRLRSHAAIASTEHANETRRRTRATVANRRLWYVRASQMSTPLYELPRGGANPSSRSQGTTPGSFANAPALGRPHAFSSPDTPGMPQPSPRTAWDFMPLDWRKQSDGCWCAPDGFVPVTQLEHARLGTVTPEMERVAQREPHL